MEKLYKRIQKLKKQEKLSKETIALFLMEEAGEVATAINVESGVKNRNLKESGAFECADVIINALRLMVEYNFDWNDVEKACDSKLSKWEGKLK